MAVIPLHCEVILTLIFAEVGGLRRALKPSLLTWQQGSWGSAAGGSPQDSSLAAVTNTLSRWSGGRHSRCQPDSPGLIPASSGQTPESAWSLFDGLQTYNSWHWDVSVILGIRAPSLTL